MKVAEGLTQPEGIFHGMLKEFYPVIGGENIDQNTKSVGTPEPAIIWNMLQPFFNQDNLLSQSNILEAQWSEDSSLLSFPEAPINPLIREGGLNINKDIKSNFIFPEEILIQKQDTESSGVVYQKGGMDLPPVPLVSRLGEQSIVQNPPSLFLLGETNSLPEADSLLKNIESHPSPLGEEMVTPVGNEKLSETIKRMGEILPVDEQSEPFEKEFSGLKRGVTDTPDSKEGLITRSSIQEKFFSKEMPVNPSVTGKEVPLQMFSEGLKGTEKITIEKNEFTAISPKGSENNMDSFLLGEPNGHQQTAVSTNNTGKVHESLLPRTEYPEMYQQISKKIIWSVKNNEEKVKLTLDPPDLGNIYMEISKDKGNIKAVLLTNNVMTKEILEANQSQLHRILKEEGFKLEKFEVFTRQDMESFRERGETLNDHSPWAKNEFREHKESPFIGSLEIPPTAMNLSHRDNNSIDVFV